VLAWKEKNSTKVGEYRNSRVQDFTKRASFFGVAPAFAPYALRDIVLPLQTNPRKPDPHLIENLKTLPKNRPLAVYYAGGYRSSIAASYVTGQRI